MQTARILAFVVAAAALGSAGAPRAHATPANPQRQLIPLYVYPFWWQSGNDWYRACESINAANGGSTVIMNPANGPGSSRSSDYDNAIDHCHDLGHHVIGYVDTNYATIPLATVKSQIDSYYSWYATQATGIDGRIDGIFLDQMSNEASTATYYHEIYTYIKAKSTTHRDVVGNPGAAATTGWQLATATQAADSIVIFEGPPTDPSGQHLGLDSYVRPAWANSYPASSIIMLVYNVPAAQIPSVCTAIGAAGIVDVTNYTITPTSTPWNFLQDASYFTAFRTNC